MTEQVTFLDSFDHAGPAYAPVKYRAAVGTYTEVTGPYHGVGGRFAGTGNELRTPASGTWNSGAVSLGVKVDAAGWTGSGEAALLGPGSFAGGADFAHHWLTVDSAGTLRVRGWAELPAAPPATVVLAASAAGALPLGAWCRLEYRTQLRTDSTRTGVVGCRVNGTEVLSGTGLVTTDPQRAVADANTWRLGHLQVDATGTDGVGGLGSGGGAVGVAYDDLRVAHDTTAGAALLAYRDDPAAPHRVVCLFPTGPGDAAELTLSGAAANWAANDEVPPDGDTSTVAKGVTATLPLDLYAATAAPTIVETDATAQVFVWGLCRTDDIPARATVTWQDGFGSARPARLFTASTYRYIGTPYPLFAGDLENARLAGLQVGWGSRSGATASLDQTYTATQVVAELWYRPDVPPVEPGPTRWHVGWVG